MFQLSDRFRRRLGLVLFVFLCLVPTGLVLALGVARHLPRHVRNAQQRLSFQLGRTVTLGRVRHPRPGVIVYEQLRCLDPAGGQPLLACGQVRVERTRSGVALPRGRGVLKLTANHVEVDARRGERLWPLLVRLLERRPGGEPFDLEWSAGEVAISGPSTCFALGGVRGSVKTRPQGAQAEVVFRPAAEDTAKPVRLRLVQNRQVDPAVLGFDLETGEGSVPSDFLGLALPPMQGLGSACRFGGSLWANHAAHGWEGELVGRFADVDLDRLVTDRFPHRLSGTAQVTLEKVRFRSGRIEHAAGMLSAGRGVASRSLVESAMHRLAVWSANPLSGPGRLVAFDQLAVAFHLDAGGLWLEGRCPAAPPGTILLGAYGQRFAQPPDGPKPLADLVGMLVGDEQSQVPAAPQTAWLLSRLPPAGLASATQTAEHATGRELR